MLTTHPRRTNTAMRNDPEGLTLVETLRKMRDRHELALWLSPILLLLGSMATAAVRGAL